MNNITLTVVSQEPASCPLWVVILSTIVAVHIVNFLAYWLIEASDETLYEKVRMYLIVSAPTVCALLFLFVLLPGRIFNEIKWAIRRRKQRCENKEQ